MTMLRWRWNAFVSSTLVDMSCPISPPHNSDDHLAHRVGASDIQASARSYQGKTGLRLNCSIIFSCIVR
jgi:hypothetical protein